MPKPRPDHDLFALLVADVFHAAGEMRREGEAIAKQAGQTQARWQLMSVISEGDWTVADAARRLGVARQGVQRIADELVAAGLARYAENPRHRRSSYLRLTEEGGRTLSEINGIAKPRHLALRRRFSRSELEQTRDVLRRAVSALREQ
ncbi:MAG TPA: MarR family winged helix-turn-helix transcriptional regulator [Gammaproteobacteria bacterium]|nr:MarR family winged helix-turn-helix transcriptional regulator [Gammaproteobacteria bacterium]